MTHYKPAHMMIRVEDPQKSIDFYNKAFGFTVDRIKKHPESDFDLYFLREPTGTLELELTHNYGHGPYTMGDGFGHLAIRTDNLEESWKEHKDMGLEVGELKGLDKGEKTYYFVTDPDGYRIEVIR